MNDERARLIDSEKFRHRFAARNFLKTKLNPFFEAVSPTFYLLSIAFTDLSLFRHCSPRNVVAYY